LDEPRAQSDVPEVHSFIIKLWLDEPPDESDRRQWRGHITHVPSGKRRYLKTLDDILNFVRPCLDSMELAQESPRLISRWLKSTQRLSQWLWQRLPKRKN
jgi:hypothetical protein